MENNSIKFYVTERLSEHREKTPEGYLLCKAVPISRVGTFEYAPSETGIPAGADGIVEMTRTEGLKVPLTISPYDTAACHWIQLRKARCYKFFSVFCSKSPEKPRI